MSELFRKVGACFYVDEAGNQYLCIEDFVRENQLHDSAALREAVVELAEEILPGIRILEDWN